MKVLITGCAGFIGSHLTERLLSDNHIIIGIDNFDEFYPKKIKERNISSFINANNFNFIEMDMLNKGKLFQIFSENNFDLVIHLAAKAGVRPSIIDPVSYFNVNVQGTINILEAMKMYQVERLIFASSSSVYGNNKKIPFSEEDNVDFPISPYAASKKSAELIISTYYQLYGIKSALLRFFTVYGPKQRPEMGMSQFIDKIYQEIPIDLYAEGKSARDYTYIDDIIDGIIQVSKYDFKYDIFNLGNSNPIMLIDVIKEIEKITKKKAIINLKPSQTGDVDITYADISRSHIKFGYSPKTNLYEGLRRQYEYYLSTIDNSIR